MNPLAHVSSPRLAVFGQPCPAPALEWPVDVATASVDHGKPIGEMLTELLSDESALYAITRESRYLTAGRKFIRLHTLLDEQFSEIGIRLTQLAARSRDFGSRQSTNHDAGARRPPAAVDDGAGQAGMIRELLGRHETLATRLRRGSEETGKRFRDRGTTDLLADLAASHERDAFMLRALLWEVENISS